MFATLLGALPRPDPSVADVDSNVRTAIAAQEAAGLDLLTDGRLRDAAFDALTRAALQGAGSVTVDAWRFAASCTSRAVKQALPGPWSIGRKAAGETGDLARATLAAAEWLRGEVEALATAGCPLVEIEESAARGIGAGSADRELFREAHRRLAAGVTKTHLTLSIVGGSAWDVGLETIAGTAYASFAFDLIAGPDNWNLVTRLPRERGVIAGALPAVDSPADTKEVLLWAARYAAGSNRRGSERVGIGSAGSWANLTWEAAVRKMERLGEVARLAALPAGEELARAIDPRAVSARAAATGDVARRPRRTRRGSTRGEPREDR